MSNKITKLVQNISKHISNTSMVKALVLSLVQYKTHNSEVVHRETLRHQKDQVSGGGA
jgi:hypothetical protein